MRRKPAAMVFTKGEDGKFICPCGCPKTLKNRKFMIGHVA